MPTGVRSLASYNKEVRPILLRQSTGRNLLIIFFGVLPAMPFVVDLVVARRCNIVAVPILVLTCSGGIAGINAAVGKEVGVGPHVPVALKQVQKLSIGLMGDRCCDRRCS